MIDRGVRMDDDARVIISLEIVRADVKAVKEIGSDRLVLMVMMGTLGILVVATVGIVQSAVIAVMIGAIVSQREIRVAHHVDPVKEDARRADHSTNLPKGIGDLSGK